MKENFEESVYEVLRKPYMRVLVPDENGGFSAEVLEFPGCFSEGETPDETYENLEKAAFNWVAAALEQGIRIPEPRAAASHSGKIALRLPKSLHRQAAEAAEREGVSLNQWIVSAISVQVGAEKAIAGLGQIDNLRKALSLLKNISWQTALDAWKSGPHAVARYHCNEPSIRFRGGIQDRFSLASTFDDSLDLQALLTQLPSMRPSRANVETLIFVAGEE